MLDWPRVNKFVASQPGLQGSRNDAQSPKVQLLGKMGATKTAEMMRDVWWLSTIHRIFVGNHGDQWKNPCKYQWNIMETHTMKKHGMILIMKYYEIAQKHPIAATWIEKSEALRIISQNIAYVILYKSQSLSPEHFLVIIQLENG